MLNFLKNLRGLFFHPSKAASQSMPKAPIPVPQAPTQQAAAPQPSFVLTPQASAYLDRAWQMNQNLTIILPAGTKLWHAGIVGPNNPAMNLKGLWTTRNLEDRNSYSGWAASDAQRLGVTAYLTEFETITDLLLADFNCYSLRQFTMQYCGYSHDNMKHALMTWSHSKNGLRGIVALNGNKDEVAVVFPQTDLTVIQHTQL